MFLDAARKLVSIGSKFCEGGIDSIGRKLSWINSFEKDRL